MGTVRDMYVRTYALKEGTQPLLSCCAKTAAAAAATAGGGAAAAGAAGGGAAGAAGAAAGGAAAAAAAAAAGAGGGGGLCPLVNPLSRCFIFRFHYIRISREPDEILSADSRSSHLVQVEYLIYQPVGIPLALHYHFR